MLCTRSSHYPCQTSGAFTVNHCKLLWFGQVCRYDTLPQIIPQRTVDGWRCRMDKPVDVVIAVHRGWHKSLGSHHNGGVCRSSQGRLGVTGVSYLICWIADRNPVNEFKYCQLLWNWQIGPWWPKKQLSNGLGHPTKRVGWPIPHTLWD